MVVDYYTVINLRSEPVDDLTRGFRMGNWRKQDDRVMNEKHLDDLFMPEEMAKKAFLLFFLYSLQKTIVIDIIRISIGKIFLRFS